MMNRNQSNELGQLEMLTIDHLVPEDHLVRKLESVIDFSFIFMRHAKRRLNESLQI